MKTQKPNSDDSLNIGSKLIFPQANTLVKTPGFFDSNKDLLFNVGGFIVFLIVISVIVAVFVDIDNFVAGFMSLFVFFGIILAVTFVATTRRVEYHDTLEQFAKVNNRLIGIRSWKADGFIGKLIDASAMDTDGFFADVPVDQDNIGRGIYTRDATKRRMRVGRYYTTGPYRGFGYISADLGGDASQMPQLIIDASANNHDFTATNLVRNLGKNQQYSLEGNFPDYFRVYAANQNAARVAYYILTPDVMQLLIQYAPEFDIEIVNGRINLYWRDAALASELRPDWVNFLPRAFYVAEQVIAPLVKRIELYRQESANQAYELKSGSNAALDVARFSVYGLRHNATSAVSRSWGRAVLIVAGVLVGLFVLFIVVGFLILMAGSY